MSQAIRGQHTDSKDLPASCDQWLQRAVGTCPVVGLVIGGVNTQALLDTGSQVSTISEQFFRDYLCGKDDDMLSTAGLLKLTAANGLDIPYLGYIELEVEAMGIKMPDCGFLVVKNISSPGDTVPCIVGMNIIRQCKQLVQAEFDTTLGGKLDSDWRHVFQQAQTCVVDRKSVLRVAGKWPERIPAESVVTITATGFNRGDGGPMLLEPLSTALPGDLVVVPTLVDLNSSCIPIQIVNLSQEDVWLSPRTRLGILSKIECMDSAQQCQVKFQRISADIEQVTLNVKDEHSKNSVQAVLEKIDVGGSEYEQAQFKSLLTKYIDVFAEDDEDLGYTDRVKHEIHVTDEEPVTQPYRRIPPNQYHEVKEHISQLVRKGVIQESNSAYASPIVLVRKADGMMMLGVQQCIG